MKQQASERPIPNTQRKAAIASGRTVDHRGSVRVEPIVDFDLDRTIFGTLQNKAARFVMRNRIAKDVHWDNAAAQNLDRAYQSAREAYPLPAIDPTLMRFLLEECDFDVEHADGSFLDHLYFGFEYTTQHFGQYSPLVMLLHSILGTGTNTFAMKAEKIPELRKLMSEFEWTHVEAFPSILRLIYGSALRRDLYELLENCGKRSVELAYTPAAKGRELIGESQSFLGWLTTLIPLGFSEQMSAKSIQEFSERIGHSMDYELLWRSPQSET